MPELAEVEYFRNKIDPKALGRKIVDIKIKDDYILKSPKKKFKNSLKGKEFKSTKRWGKYLFLEFDNKDLLLHFAMSGNIKFYNTNNDEPEYSKIIFNFDDGHSLSIISIRKFGRVQVVNDYKKFIEKNGIGPDALEVSLEEFKKIMEYKKRSFAKAALLDQKAISGLGNLYSDETLFQSHIFPKRKISELDENQIETMYSNMKEILNKAIKCIKNHTDYPDNFIIPHRNKEGTCPVCDTKLKQLKISSRTTYYCPNCQKSV
jgi:formamidopyrimidine-DNA glycosylase